jgi:nucleotide-binding universal stress UspA family protein
VLGVMPERHVAELSRLSSLPEREPLASNLSAMNRHASIAGIKIETILAPTDLSRASKTGVRHALNAAKELNARVIVHYAITTREIAEFGRKRQAGAFVAARFNGLLQICEARLQRFLNRHFADDLKSIKIELSVDFGTPEKSIIATAKTEGADVIIMSTSRRTPFTKFVRGSVTERIVRNAPCPVLSIPANGAVRERKSFTGVLDESEVASSISQKRRANA